MNAALEVVLPVFAVILCGFLVAKHTHLIGSQGLKGLSNFVFYVATPALMFRTLSRGDAAHAADLTLVQSYFLGVVVLYGFALLVGRIAFGLNVQERGVMAMGAVFSNTVMLGIPIIYNAYGEDGLVLMMLIISFHSMILIPMATMVVEIGRGAGGHPFKVLGAMLRSLAANPVIVSMAAGLLWGVFGWNIPRMADSVLVMLSGAMLPASLFTLGATLTTFSLRGDAVQSAVLVFLKLVLHPTAAYVLAAHVFMLPPLTVAVATVVAALPSGINVFILAERYDCYVARTATAVLVSTALSLLTLGALISAFGPTP